MGATARRIACVGGLYKKIYTSAKKSTLFVRFVRNTYVLGFRIWPAYHIAFSKTTALATATIPLLTIPAALIVPRLSDGHDRRYWICSVALVMAVGTALIGFTPTSAPVLWFLILGLGAGAIFPLLMALPLDIRGTPAAVTDLVAWMLGLGYLMGASSPLLIGVLRDATGGFVIPVGAGLTGAGILCALLVLFVPKSDVRRGGMATNSR